MFLLVFCQGVNCRTKQTKPRTNWKILVLMDSLQFVRMKPCPQCIQVYRYYKSWEIRCSVPTHSVSWSLPMAPWHCNNTNKQNTMPQVSMWKNCLRDLGQHQHEVVLLSGQYAYIRVLQPSGIYSAELRRELSASDKILNDSSISFLLPLLTALFIYSSSS